MKNSSGPTWKQQQNVFQPNQESNIEVSRDTLTVRQKQDKGKTVSLWNKRCSTNVNPQKLNKVQKELSNTYQEEQKEYIQRQMNKIRYSIDDRQSRIALQTANEVSKRKTNSRAKLKAAKQEERLQLRKEYFKNLLRNSPKVTMTKIIHSQLDTRFRTVYSRRIQ